MEITLKAEVGGRTLSIQTGKMAKQASGSAVVQYGETLVLVTVVASDDVREGIDFLPLSVEYQEKIYAAGRIPGNYFRREIGRPSEKETLTSRIIDRPIRPLFPKNFNFETQVIATVLSMDHENDPDTLAMIGASTALEISDIPFEGPIACVRVGRLNGKLMVNPTINDLKRCDINVMVAGSRDAVVMVEGSSDMVSEAEMLEAIFFGHEAMQSIIDLQIKLREVTGVPKRIFTIKEKDGELVSKLEESSLELFREAVKIPEKIKRHNRLNEIKTEVFENLGEDYAERKAEVYSIFHDIERRIIRDLVLNEGKRIDGRRFDEVRPITCEVGLLPRPHGSALFTRGETQSLSVLTLGSSSDEQRVETLSGEEFRPFMLHYNFPPFSVGEVKRVGSPSRRDIGHGGLSTRAVEKILPIKSDFDYTIRIVSEILESNGSSSMATVCAASLALMDGGVPVKCPVSGIAMGLMKEDDKLVILTDIMGDEDHMGDMDFKITGTEKGITAIQMDIKIQGLSRDIMETALEQAKSGRLFILEKMIETIKESRQEISPYAPKVFSLKITPDKIRDIIGPGGKTIRFIQNESNSRLDVDDNGNIKVSAQNTEEAQIAINMIEKIAMVPEVGKVYEGKVVRVVDFGAFVEIIPGTDGLVHISQLDTRRVTRVSDVVREGEKIKVKVLEITRDGKIRLSRKAVIEEGYGRSKKPL
ncbi:polynucleotide phosphorylase [Candidatus Magnetomoraceae bacterium gMMP-15]